MEQQELSVWIPAITGLAGAFIGAVSSFIPTLITERCKQRRESAQLRASLVAEIAAIIEIAEMRKYQEGLQSVCVHLASQPPGTIFQYPVGIPDHYSRIYQANADRIGEIDSDSAKSIVTFHQLVDAVVQDVRPGGALANGAELEGFEEAERVLAKAFKIGTNLTGRA